MPVFEGLLPPKHEDIAQTLIFHLAEWHPLAKLRLQTEGSLALLNQALWWLSVQVNQFQRVTCTAFETKELPQESTWRQRRELAEMQLGHRKIPARSSPLPISFNINTYKFHALGDYTQAIKTFGTIDSYSIQIVSVLPLPICKFELKHTKDKRAHRLIKHMYGSLNKKAVEAQFSRQEKQQTILWQRNNLSLDLEEMNDENSSPLIHHFMMPKVRQDNVFSLPRLLCKNHGDPVLKVCYVEAPFAPCLMSPVHSLGGFHATTEGPPIVQIARIRLWWWWVQLHCPAAKCHPTHQYRHSHPV